MAFLDAFVPAFGLIVLGLVLRRRLLTEAVVWAGIERLVFFVLLPALLCVSIGTTDLAAVSTGGLVLSVLAGLAAGFAGALVLRLVFGLDFPAFTSAVQGGIRFNNFLGFALAGPLFGTTGLAVGAVLTGIIVPLVNLTLVATFAAGSGRRVSLGGFLLALARNPLIVGCLAGFALNAAGGPPPGLGPLLRAIGSASVALGLMTVGAALTLSMLTARLGIQAATIVLKLSVVPAATLLAARALGLDATEAALVALFMGMPTASTSYVTARQMGGDAPLMAAITTSQHIVAVVTLPILAWLVR